MENGSPLDVERKISLGGKEYVLTFPVPALWAFRKLTGMSLMAGFSERELMNQQPVICSACGDEFACTAEDLNHCACGAELDAKGRRERAENIERRMERIAQLCWAGLRKHHPEMSFDEVAGQIYIANLSYVEEQVVTAFFASMPQRTEKGEEPESADRPLAEAVN